jgi:hypothetical protein
MEVYFINLMYVNVISLICFKVHIYQQYFLTLVIRINKINILRLRNYSSGLSCREMNDERNFCLIGELSQHVLIPVYIGIP